MMQFSQNLVPYALDCSVYGARILRQLLMI